MDPPATRQHVWLLPVNQGDPTACRAVVRRAIESDNSCLFNAVAYNLERTRSAARRLRQVVKNQVQADPLTFNDGMLGKENHAYQEWIMNMDNWGGPIELIILAKCACIIFWLSKHHTQSSTMVVPAAQRLV